MSLDHIVKGSYGQTIQITIQEDGVALDVSGYTTTKQIIFKAPSGKIVTKTATFATDGTDGVVECTLADGDIDEEGEWKVQASIVSGTAGLRTVATKFDVNEFLEN